MGCLTNLKILDVGQCHNLTELPESLGDAHSLQHLKLEFSGLRKLPSSIHQLANLSHISTNADDEMLHGIAHPGGMTALQQLCTGAHPRELKDMNELRTLRLGSLHLVTSREEAREAELHRKTHLTSLELCFDHIYDPYDRATPEDADHGAADRDEGVLEGLQPDLAGIRELTIRQYRGARWPRWMMDASTNQGFPSLEELLISHCPMLEELPPLPPTLRRLDISHCPMLEGLPPLPPTLRRLDISKCPMLKGLPPLPPTLQALDISNCPMREGLPPLPPSLQRLNISNCPMLEGLPPLPPSLQGLDISNCPMLEGLPPLPPTLRQLSILNCPKAEWASDGHLLSGGKPFGGQLLLSTSLLVDLTVRVVFPEHADDDDAQVISQLLAVCLRLLPTHESLTISGFRRLPFVAQSKAATIVNRTGMLLCPPGEELLQPLTSLSYLRISDSQLLTPFPLVRASISYREPAKTAGDDIPDNNTTSAPVAGSSSSSLPSSSLSIIPATSSSSHPPQNQMLMEKLRFEGTPRLIKKLLRGMAPFKHPRRLEFYSCKELGFLGDEDCEGLDELEEALLALAPSLSHLQFYACANLRRLPWKLSCLFSLETLEILYCPELESLPEAGLPPALQELLISRCSEELMERCRKEAGADRHKISHIPKCEIRSNYLL